LILLLMLAALVACSDTAPLPGPAAAPPAVLGQRHPALFASQSEAAGLKAVRNLPLDPDTPVGEALEAIARHLGETYFATAPDGRPTGIAFQILRIDSIATGGRPLLVGVVDLRDPQQLAGALFFQGSSGGAVTLQLIVASFTQPQLDPPLLDGLVVLRNGQPMEELDHINLSGLLVPRLARGAAVMAVRAAVESGSHAL
jgi:hypothetical protein